MTHTYALLEVPQVFYNQVKAKLLEAGYQHAIQDESRTGREECLDMHGIALIAAADENCEEHQ
jgi:hypothetical protein